MTQRITETMVKARMQWVSEEAKLNLQLEHSDYGWTLYQSEPGTKRHLTQLAYSETTRGMFEILKGMYELLTAMRGK